MARFPRPGALYRPLGEADVTTVADAAFAVLEKSGVAVHSSRAHEALVGAGAVRADDEPVVRLPRHMVEAAIESNPSMVTLYGRDGADDVVLGGGRVHYGTGGTAVYVLDPDTGEHRLSTLDDVVLNARLVEVLDNIDLFTINVFPSEIEDRDRIDANRFFHALDNTRKHVMGGIYSLAGCERAVAMAELIAGGGEQLRARPFVSFITLVISPFKIDREYGHATCFLADRGLPVVVPTEPLCGLTSPITLAGNVLVHVAETLAGITLVQAVRPGAPGICGSVGSTVDLRTMGHLGGSIERAMINAAVAQMAQHFGLPLYSTSGTSDAKAVDVQAAYESAMSNLLVGLAGADYLHDAAGLMEFDLTVAYDKLVLDDEIVGMCQRVLRGIEVDDDKLGLDLILEKGPGRDFIGEHHTVRHMRDELFFPKLANRDTRASHRPDDDALARARAVVREVRDAPADSKLDPDVRLRVLEEFPEIVR